MENGFQIVLKLTNETLRDSDKERIFKDFASLLGWEPSEFIKPNKDIEDISNGHIIVEHGLLNSAVITFLNSPFIELSNEKKRSLLELSYNNLIDWHIYVESDRASFVFNRQDNPDPIIRRISPNDFNSLKSSTFTEITDLNKNPNFPQLDEALITNIAVWKRTLAAEFRSSLPLTNYSSLFNCIIFIRAAEDLKKRETNVYTQFLLDEWTLLNKKENNGTLKKIINNSLKKIVKGSYLNIINVSTLSDFDNLDSDLIYNLLNSFYKNPQLPYRYDFAVMSKHALSRIYEKYVSTLRFDEDNPQLSFLPSIPKEEYSKTYGSVYTPQFIARFFARYLSENTPPKTLRNMKILDPACGSGIFLRTVLEFLLTPAFDPYSSYDYKNIFMNVYGNDIDPNAVEASKLSIALLHLVVLGGSLPTKLNLLHKNSLEYYYTNKRFKNYFDVIIANPPFIPFEKQYDDLKDSVLEYLDDLGTNKPDSSLAFLKLGVDLVKPGGMCFFVLPHAFLKTESAKKIREYVFERMNIVGLIDLSSITVFKEKGSYVILLILQKKINQQLDLYVHKSTIVICQDLVGHALQDFLNNIEKETNFYSVFNVEQNSFDNSDWSKVLIPPSASNLYKKVNRFKSLGEIFEVRQGIITGGDDVFIIKRDAIPKNEELIWKPLLRDREMQKYIVPVESLSYVFYPIIDNNKLDEYDLKEGFPKTWDYLKSNKKKLTSRKILKDKNWWFPVNLRNPNELFSPKIITPHLILMPKFAIDIEGKFSVSHGPYIFHKYDSDPEVLYFLSAILNSSVGAWLVSTHSDKYSRGYARLEVKTLKSIPIPDPAKVEKELFTSIIKLVKKKVLNKNKTIDLEINELVATLYELDPNEKIFVGFEGLNV